MLPIYVARDINVDDANVGDIMRAHNLRKNVTTYLAQILNHICYESTYFLFQLVINYFKPIKACTPKRGTILPRSYIQLHGILCKNACGSD